MESEVILPVCKNVILHVHVSLLYKCRIFVYVDIV